MDEIKTYTKKTNFHQKIKIQILPPKIIRFSPKKIKISPNKSELSPIN